MKKFMIRIATLSLLLTAATIAAQAETSWTNYKPGLVNSALDRGETVLLGYLSSWWGTCARQKNVLNELRASHPKYDKSIKFVLIDWDTFSSHSVTTSRNIPRRSTLVLIKGSKEIGRLVAVTGVTEIKAFLENALK
mgnify:CR=1 FL=1